MQVSPGCVLIGQNVEGGGGGRESRSEWAAILDAWISSGAPEAAGDRVFYPRDEEDGLKAASHFLAC